MSVLGPFLFRLTRRLGGQISKKEPILEYEIGESVTHPGYCSAEAVNYDGDGEIYTTVFLGPRSRERAEEFVTWQGTINTRDQAARHVVSGQ
jgi:hypothetical protein